MNPKRAERVGLSVVEFGRVCELLGREPRGVELDLFGVMWSEHCSYKTSRPLLCQLHGTAADTGQRHR